MEAYKILFIEDDPYRIGLFDIWLPVNFRLVPATSAGSALGLIRKDRGFIYAGICLDHDLQNQAKTDKDRDLSGSSIIKSIIENMNRSIPILVHSMNPEKAPIMVRKLQSAGFDVIRIPFGDLTQTKFKEWCEEVQENWNDHHEE
jgi:CheY-like chemotaxis protein